MTFPWVLPSRFAMKGPPIINVVNRGDVQTPVRVEFKGPATNPKNTNQTTGYAFIRGYLYHNEAPLTLTLEPADTILDCIDRVVLRFDEVAREIRLAVKTGAFSSTPQAPGLEETSTIKELGLAQVFARHGATSIPTANITDERLTNTCGLVSSIIEIPAQEMWDVWNAALDQIETAWDQQTSGIAAAWQAQTNAIESAWQTQTGGVNADWEAQSGAIGAACFSPGRRWA